MKNILLFALLFSGTVASAQVCQTNTDKAGVTHRMAIVQFGKDTVVLGKPFKAKDKIGMSLDFSGSKGGFKCTANIRSKSPVLLNDSIDLHKSYLCLSTADGDTVNFVPDKASPQRLHHGVIKTNGTVTVFITTYLSAGQFAKLNKARLSNIRLYIDNNTYADIPVNDIEKNKLQYAINYLLRP